MATKTPHQPLRDYITTIRGVIDKDDLFGNYLTRLVYREQRIQVNGLFRRVRAVYEAVAAAGGNLADARVWTARSVRWWRTGKAIDQKFARYETDPRAAHAMDDLLKFLASLPEELLKATPPEAPPAVPQRQSASATPQSANAQPAPNPFKRALVPPTPPPAAPAPRAFGRPAVPPGQPARPQSPFARPAQSPTAPAASPPAPPSSSPFGQRPSFPTLDPLPFQVAACFDVLGITPDSAKPTAPQKETSLPDWLVAAEEKKLPVSTDKQPLPDDLKGLIERLVGCTDDADEALRILKKIGSLNDMRAIDYLHNLLRDLGEGDTLIEMFAAIGGDVGMAGLLTMLPVAPEKRDGWLLALLTVAREAVSSGRALSDPSMAVIWEIALAESSTEVPFSANALRLLAMTGRREALPILWDHYTSQDVAQRRTALFCIAQLDPGDRLPHLLMGIENLGDANLTATGPFGSPAETPNVGIPFEKLEAVLYDSGLSKPKAAALMLISHMADERVVPLLISQLSRRIPRLREVALNQLRRLGAKSAAGAVADLMNRDQTQQRAAANVLCAWEDPRCVPVLLPKPQADKVEETVSAIRWLGHLPHPDFDGWLMDSVTMWLKTFDEVSHKDPPDVNDITATEDALVSILEIIASKSPRNLRPAVEKMLVPSTTKLKLTIVTLLGKTVQNRSSVVPQDWARDTLRLLVADESPIVSYRAALVCQDEPSARELLASGSEIKRLLGVRILWNLKDARSLTGCLADRSAAVRDAAIWSLGQIPAEDSASIDALRALIDTADMLDTWNMNPALLAWRGLAKLGAIAPSQSPVKPAVAS